MRYCPSPLAVLVILTLSAGARAQDPVFPARAVQLIVPYSTGTTADILARALGPRLSERWKVSVVTDNRPGATGAIGVAAAAKAAPDGHTIVFVVASYSIIPALYTNLAFDPVKSFSPVIQISTSPLALVIHPKLAPRTVREFVQLAKRRPGELMYASPGNGSAQHLAMELFKLETGVNIVHVPHRGLSGAMTDLMGGHVQAIISTVQTVHPHVNSHRLRMIAATGGSRSSAFPDVPTLREQGFALDFETWSGALVSADTAPAYLTKLNGDFNAVLQTAEVRELMARQGMTPVGGPPERFRALIERELPRWARVVQTAKIKVD